MKCHSEKLSFRKKQTTVRKLTNHIVLGVKWIDGRAIFVGLKAFDDNLLDMHGESQYKKHTQPGGAANPPTDTKAATLPLSRKLRLNHDQEVDLETQE